MVGLSLTGSLVGGVMFGLSNRRKPETVPAGSQRPGDAPPAATP
jgi:hypothetical protein